MIDEEAIKLDIIGLMTNVYYDTQTYGSQADKITAYATGLANIIVNAIQSANLISGVPTEIGGVTLESGRSGDLE